MENLLLILETWLPTIFSAVAAVVAFFRTGKISSQLKKLCPNNDDVRDLEARVARLESTLAEIYKAVQK